MLRNIEINTGSKDLGKYHESTCGLMQFSRDKRKLPDDDGIKV
jgi:hypothetical protein